MSGSNRHFGVCMACGCIQEPQGYYGDENLNKLVRDANAAFEKESQPGAERKFLTQGMEASHYIQKANAWWAVKQWLMKDNRTALSTDRVTFNNTKADRASTQTDYRSGWDCPEPLSFASLQTFVQSHLSSQTIPNTEYIADNDRTAHCCKECNDLMDVRGWTTHLLWATPLREGNALKGVNPRDEIDNGAGRLIPIRAVEIVTARDVILEIPYEQRGDGAQNDRGHYYTAVLSYFIHRCIRGLTVFPRQGHRRERTQMNIRIYVIIPVLALKLLCIFKEYAQRWSAVREETRSPHNYVGVMTLYVSYAMYMMYVCDQNIRKIPFDSFHLFYMRELGYAPKWRKNKFPTVWKYVLRSEELDDNAATTSEQVQTVVENLVRLYTKHVTSLLAVIHPDSPVYFNRLSDKNQLKVNDKWIPHFVNRHEMWKLRNLHDLANMKHDSVQFSLYVMVIGIAPIAVSIQRMYCDDNPTFLEIIYRWRDECLRGEYKRISEQHNTSLERAKTLYQMCCVPLSLLQEKGVLQDNQEVDEVVRFSTQAFNACEDVLKTLKPISVWKAALALRDHGVLIKRRSVRRPRLPQKDPYSLYMGCCFSMSSDQHLLLKECFFMRTGLQVEA